MAHHCFRLVAFLLPIIDDEIWLAQRNTEPMKGYYGAIGGKNDRALEDGLFEVLHQVNLPTGTHYPSEDTVARIARRELLSETAAREFCEEVFSLNTYPQDYSVGDITDLLRIGFIGDVLPAAPTITNLCYFYVGQVKRNGFSINQRELSDFKPLSKVPVESIWLLTKMALVQLRHLHHLFREGGGYLPFDRNHCSVRLAEQHEPRFTEYRDTDMAGLHLYYFRHHIKAPETIYGRPAISSIEEALYLDKTPNDIFGKESQLINERIVPLQ